MLLLLWSVGLLLVLTSSAAANQPGAVHSTQDVTGDTIQSDSTVYTIG